MLKFKTMATAIRIQKKTTTMDQDGFPVDTWADVINEDILCEWKNKFGGQVYSAASVDAVEPASIRLWYIPGIDETCRVIRMDDSTIQKELNPIFEIINVDDVEKRHQQLELEVKRYVEG